MAVMPELRESTAEWPGAFRHGTNEFVEDSTSGDVALVNGIATADCLQSVSRPILTGLPLQLGLVPRRASCNRQAGATVSDCLPTKVVELAGSKTRPLFGAVEGPVEIEHEVGKIILIHTARSSATGGELFVVVRPHGMTNRRRTYLKQLLDLPDDTWPRGRLSGKRASVGACEGASISETLGAGGGEWRPPTL